MGLTENGIVLLTIKCIGDGGGEQVAVDVRAGLMGLELLPSDNLVVMFDDGADDGTVNMQTLPDEEWNTAGIFLPLILTEEKPQRVAASVTEGVLALLQH